MTRDLPEILCCPACRGDLSLADADPAAPVVETGALQCVACGARYPVERGVPRFVSTDGYVASFSYEWTRWRRVQIDSVTGGVESEETFAHKTGLSRQDLRGRRVLDVGCGAGRFLDVASRWGGRVVGVDYSYAVDAAHENVGHRPGVDVVQADVFHLPFKPGAFDVVYSLGVLHHTRDTKRAFLSLPPLLKDGGQLAVWLYYYPDALYRRASDLWRRLLRPLPHWTIRAWSWLLCALLSGLYRRSFMQRAPWSVLPRLVPVAIHPEWRWRVLDTFDWYSPTFQDKECDPLRVLGWCHDGAVRHVEFLSFPTSLRATYDPQQKLPLVKGMPDFRCKRFAIFGAGQGGQVALAALDALGIRPQVVAVCDNDPAKTGLSFAGHVVRRFEGLSRDSYDHVVIGSLAGGPAIAEQLTRAGLLAQRDFYTVPYLTEHQSVLQLASRV